VGSKRVVVINEYHGSFVGTLQDFEEFSSNEGWLLIECLFYELGPVLKIGLKVL